MAIPPFPSQDLAKLVLGYLAEEQLMTAYDEFLQASPYLDAFRNEYDRIFMTSLRNILAEYRAVKIYVETCKPFVLRKKMLQCSNLLDIVKLLMSYVDTNKIQSPDVTSERTSFSKPNTSGTSKQSYCETCKSMNLTAGICQNKQCKSNAQAASHVETNNLKNSVETTALEDLPGNHSTAKKKSPKGVQKDSTIESNVIINGTTHQSTSSCNSSNNGFSCNQSSLIKPNENVSCNSSGAVKTTDTPESREKIEEFNNIFKKVCNNKSNSDTRLSTMSESEDRNSHSSFQTFVSGPSGNENRNNPVPDSSTSESTITMQSLVKENSLNVSQTVPSEVSREVNDHPEAQIINTYHPYPRIKPKTNDPKIKILSDIKVDRPFPTLSNATSTPLMQTIVINGTPAYSQKLPMANDNYTKDEIMAMPTIIVVPTSGSSQDITPIQPLLSQRVKKGKTKTTSSKNLLGPLVIDVSSSPVAKTKKDSSSQPAISLQSGIETGLVRTVDSMKNASVPKDNTLFDATQTNTPQILPPVRKSSSTPRRNSHIRVLDFTTPRRILHETPHETVPEETNESVEVLVAGGPNIVFPETSNCSNNIISMSSVKVHKIETCLVTKVNESKAKKSNWDADLRALAVTDEEISLPLIKKPRVKSSKKKVDKSNDVQEKEIEENLESKRKRSKRKHSPKDKKSKRKKLEEEEEQYNDVVNSNETNITVKPTFNIVTGPQQTTENSKVSDGQNKSNSEEVRETPEAERISLQNEIGAKLNISDFLETPYKQALYDIQMETPKFLGSVLPDDPISDIKIMNIPTPRFFDTPKPTQSTPSYASRATDYSSGGSYYKPDEQDYLKFPDLDCPVNSSKEVPNAELPKKADNNSKKSSRPVRKCTKNVSYKATSKVKLTDDKVEVNSSCSETLSVNSSFEQSKEVLKTPKTPKIPKPNKSKSRSKSEPRKNKTRKTPVKKSSNTFMKIKPRRPTPIKDNKKTRNKSVIALTAPQKAQVKKKTSGKDKNVQITSAVTSAPTKSRRKSSTPRKLHCTKQFNSESSTDSPELIERNTRNITSDSTFVSAQCQDSDTEQLALRWSDDGSQDSKIKVPECEDISKIKQYIESSLLNKPESYESKGTLQVDLIKRGFDAETAKIIERDLLDTPDLEQSREIYVEIPEAKPHGSTSEETTGRDTTLAPADLQRDEQTEDDVLELSVHECNEESHNYVTFNSETKDSPKGNHVSLKDAWSMEVCIDDGVPIRLRATSFNILFDNEPQDMYTGYSFKETEVAVSSISNIDSLYTPLKDRRSQCYEIFDSTLTSLDTPLKTNSPRELIHKTTEIEIVVEEEKVETKDKTDNNKKRKRMQASSSPDSSLNEIKKTKPETQYLFNSTNIQNIDIESVLKKLHGPEGL